MAKTFIVAIVFWACIAATWKLATIFSPLLRFTDNQRMRVTNLGDLPFYRDADAALGQNANRVVFLGDSITYQWDLWESFHNANYVNRGIRGQTTGDMLVRFRQDVINLHPKTVVILAGINDIGEHNVDGDLDQRHKLGNIESNIQTMAELAELHGIRPVFLSVIPVHFYARGDEFLSKLIPPALVTEHNKWLKSFCELNHYQYIDVYSAMLDDRGMLRRELSEDGIHPNSKGYKVMADVFSSQFQQPVPAGYTSCRSGL